jgi:hypothetical protein
MQVLSRLIRMELLHILPIALDDVGYWVTTILELTWYTLIYT